MADSLQQNDSYLRNKHKSSRVFWGAAIASLGMLCVWIYNSTIISIDREHYYITPTVAAITLFFMIVWLAVFLFYAANIKDHFFRVILLVLFSLQVISVCIYIMQKFFACNFAVLKTIDSIVSILDLLSYIAISIYTITRKRTGRVLRAAAITLLVGRVLAISFPFIVLALSALCSIESTTCINIIILYGVAIIPMATDLFFLGALSFSRPKYIKENKETIG